MRLYRCFHIKIFLRKGAALFSADASNWTNRRKPHRQHPTSLQTASKPLIPCSVSEIMFQHIYRQEKKENHFVLPHFQWLSWIPDMAILADPRPEQATENHSNVLDQNEWQNEISAKNIWDIAWCWNLTCRLYKSFWLKLYLLLCCLSSHYCEKWKEKGIKMVMLMITNGCKELVDN